MVPSGDHPRSRGVYRSDSERLSYAAGSSPLARGLLQSAVRTLPSLGIIPARAGFTYWDGEALPTIGDHPRSRGVYWITTAAASLSPGSSPLARGLPAPTEKNASVKGIIPARAGFTASLWEIYPEYGDHPRSRGVYSFDIQPSHRVTGSSPLARGLPHIRHVQDSTPGIIPARAGFTAHGASAP